MKKTNFYLALLFSIILFSCEKDQNLDPIIKENGNKNARQTALSQFTSTPFASGLVSPIGMALDNQGRIWVTEKGSGNNDGKISVIMPDGSKSVAITGFDSSIDPFEGQPQGLTHPLIRDGKLYFLDGVYGRLYIVNIGNYMPNNPPIQANTLAYEDLKTYIVAQNLTSDNNSNVYNLCFGKTGDLYINDAGANAIIKRDKHTKALSVFAIIPGHPVPPNPFGVPFTQAVPTGMVWNGSHFIVSTLGGFPFSEGVSSIFQISTSGIVTVYAGGFTSLTDICLTPHKQPLLLQFAKFVFAPPIIGFQPFTGRILDANKNVLLDNLMMPTSLIRGENNYFVLSTALGTVEKLSGN